MALRLLERIPINQMLLVGIVIRLCVIAYSIFHDAHFRVKYTDIDYMIVVDGASEMAKGGSPFDRTTYRYTPLLAFLVLPAALIANPLGKIVFALSDVGAAKYAYQVLCTYASERSAKLMTGLFILFNPIVLNVSTRGNSDMLITFMSMMVLAKFAEKKYYVAGSVLGFAVHFKIYPIIYALPLVLGLWENSDGAASSSGFLRRMSAVLPRAFLCGVLFIVFFTIPTALCYALYGQQYLDEAFLYHFYREDHRHNFSPYWLLMYLNMGQRALGVGVDHSAGLIAFVPQALVLAFTSWKLRRNIAHACCVETVLFVAFNKVCTVQYFVWFLPFLGFVFCDTNDSNSHEANLRGGKLEAQTPEYKPPGVLTIVAVITAWSATIPLWVFTAFPLEFQGINHFGRLWIVSCIFFLATVLLAAWLGRICRKKQLRLRDQGRKGKKRI